jgi:lipoate-protein ligase A
MLFIDITFDSLEENLAFDEALIQAAEEGESDQQVLRLWEARSAFIVLGRSSKIADEVHIERAEQAGLPILRRCSGGATILAAPGCFFYAVLLSLRDQPQLRMLDEAHRYVMSRVARAVTPFSPGVRLDGTCDLVLDGRKVSGNSLRVQRHWLLYHGTLLLNMDLNLISTYLRHPPREPEYRAGRPHAEFVANLMIPRGQLAASLRREWQADRSYGDLPKSRIHRLITERYSQSSWNRQR